MFDTDKSGSIDYHELKVAIRALGFDVKKEVRAPPRVPARAPGGSRNAARRCRVSGGAAQEVRRIMAEVDREGTGTIEFPDFLSISASAPRRRSPPSELQISADAHLRHSDGEDFVPGSGRGDREGVRAVRRRRDGGDHAEEHAADRARPR